MINISNNGFISIHRGDSFSVPLFLDIGQCGNPVRFDITKNPGSIIYLGVMEPSKKFEDAVIRKKYTSESVVNDQHDIVVSFSPEDTLNLFPGKYYYEIKIAHADGRVDTLTPRTEFFIFE